MRTVIFRFFAGLLALLLIIVMTSADAKLWSIKQWVMNVVGFLLFASFAIGGEKIGDRVLSFFFPVPKAQRKLDEDQDKFEGSEDSEF